MLPFSVLKSEVLDWWTESQSKHVKIESKKHCNEPDKDEQSHAQFFTAAVSSEQKSILSSLHKNCSTKNKHLKTRMGGRT